jgi:tRNA-dihydrouridine synthase A
MMDWTDRHCRVFHRILAPEAVLYTEMVTAAAIKHGPRDRLLAFSPMEHPVVLQLGGSDPALLAEAARVGQDYGYDAINLNCGCPSDRVQAGRFGACLMAEPDLVADSVAAMKAAVSIPVTVKTRIGIDRSEGFDFVATFIGRVAAAGCDHFIVHARKAWLKGLSPKENREVPPLDYTLVHRLKREFPKLRIEINGGITTMEAICDQLTHVDGVMIGREAYHSPMFLAESTAMLAGREPPSRMAVIEAYRPYIEQQLAQGSRLRSMTRHMIGLFNTMPGGKQWRRCLSENATSPAAGLSVLDEALRFVTPQDLETAA